MAVLGSDIGGVWDITSTLAVVTGRRALAEQVLRRWTTPRGGLFYNPRYGYDVMSEIGATTPQHVIEQKLIEQARAEEEVRSVRVKVTKTNETLRVEGLIQDSDGPFKLTLTASKLTAQALLDGTLFAQLKTQEAA
jgi:hypothetical protein